MIIEITEDRSRWRTTDYTWHVTMDGVSVAVAKTAGAGDNVAQEVSERDDVALIESAIAALGHLEEALNIALDNTTNTDDTIMVEGMTLAAPTNDTECISSGEPAFYAVQEQTMTRVYCFDCYRDLGKDMTFDQSPLLAQCAAFVRAVRTNQRVIDIIAEAERLDAALAKEGY